YLGMVRQWQEAFYNHRYSSSTMSGNPDFVKLSEAFGGVGRRVTKKEEVDGAIQWALTIKIAFGFAISPDQVASWFIQSSSSSSGGAPCDR
ncbi:MAG: hypothetical protein RL085_786, partial [Actinomycetota bacterium]